MRTAVERLFMAFVAVTAWACVLFATYIMSIMSDIFRHFGDGVLKYIIAAILIIGLIVPFVFYKKLGSVCPISVCFICASILAFFISCSVIMFARCYISEFSRDKWLENEELRIYMIDDLEREYGVIGKSQNEIEALLGMPYISKNNGLCYEYYVGDSLIDPITYDIVFHDGIAVSATLTEH